VLAVPALGTFGVAAIAAHQIVYWLSQDSNITPPVCVAAYAGAAVAGSDPWKTGWTAFKFAKMLYVMPILFAFTPGILFQGKVVDINAPKFDAPFASVVAMKVKTDQEIAKGDVVALINAGGETLEVKAKSDATASRIYTHAGSMINPGDQLIRTEKAATPYKVFASFFSAFLGTIAFSSLMMGYWIRRTSVIEWILLAPATVLLYWPTPITDIAGACIVALVWFMQKSKNKRDEALAQASA
jgi:TRAP-type uncharacterized transport system fused permease subunit